MGPQRYIQTVGEHSIQAERLCAELLEPAADFFAGACFVESDLDEVVQERTLTHQNGRISYIAFTAVKLDDPEDLDDDELSALGFQLTLTEEAPYVEGMYWPGMTDRQLASGDEVIVDVHNALDGQSGGIIDLSECSVAEIWEFSIDDGDMELSKTVRWEYYDDEDESEPVAVVDGHCEEALCTTTLGNTVEEEAILRASDKELTERFSTDDVELIVNALRLLGFSNDFMIEEIMDQGNVR